MRINIDLELSKTKELEDYIKDQLPDLLNEYFFKNPTELNKIIRECLKGQLKSCTCEILQGKEIRTILTERIMKEIGDINA